MAPGPLGGGVTSPLRELLLLAVFGVLFVGVAVLGGVLALGEWVTGLSKED